MSLQQLFGFNVIEDDSVPDGSVVVISNDLHLSSRFAIKIERTVGTNGSYIFHRLHPSARASISDIYSQIQSQLNVNAYYPSFPINFFTKSKKEIKLPDIKLIDTKEDYMYLKTCESCQDEKDCKPILIENESAKFVCQYCFNYLKQTGVFE